MKCPLCGKEATTLWYKEEEDSNGTEVWAEVENMGYCIDCKQPFSYRKLGPLSYPKTRNNNV